MNGGNNYVFGYIDYSQNNGLKNTSKNGQFQLDLLKMTFWSSWTKGQKNQKWGLFFIDYIL
jgi:hypothetical protein